MKHARLAAVVLALLCTIPPAGAADLTCHGAPNVESFRYNWRLRGGLSWVAGVMFPTSGVGELKTTYEAGGAKTIDSSLLITAAAGKSGFYAYETQMDTAGLRTLMTYHAYAWKDKSRKDRTFFDYPAGLARRRKETPDKQWERNDPLPGSSFHDVVSMIHYLRLSAANIHGPLSSAIYSDGKSYPVIVRPAERLTVSLGNQQIGALGFELVDAPGGKKWPGGMKIWLSDDARRIPVRIEIIQSMASLQLDLQSVDACTFLHAPK